MKRAMNKYTLLILLCLLTLFTLVQITGAQNNQNPIEATEYDALHLQAEQMVADDSSIDHEEAYQRIRRQTHVTELRGEIKKLHPLHYAGIWIERDLNYRIVIATKGELSKTDKITYQAIVEKYELTDYVHYITVNHSYDELQKMRDHLYEIPSIATTIKITDIDIVENNIDIYMLHNSNNPSVESIVTEIVQNTPQLRTASYTPIEYQDLFNIIFVNQEEIEPHAQNEIYD